MKGKFSLNRLLHHKKLMVVFSIVAAVAIWASIHAASSMASAVISVPVNLDLSGTYAGNDGMVIFGGATQWADVHVRGSWLIINRLGEGDVRVTGEYSGITRAGEWRIPLRPTKNSQEDFTIVSVTPTTAVIECDYVARKSLPIEADIEGVTLEGTPDFQLATPTIESPGIENGTIVVEGPRSTIDRIVRLTAQVDEPSAISAVTTFSATLMAFDAKDEAVDIEHCTFEGLSDGENKVNIVVPLLQQVTVNFTYTLENKPAGLGELRNFVTLSPSSIDLVGSPDQVVSVAESIANLGAFSLYHVSKDNAQKTIPLNIPPGISVLDKTTEVTVSFDTKRFQTKTLDLTLTDKNTQVRNLTRPWTMSTQKIRVTLVGNATSINRIKESHLSAVVDIAGDDTVGLRERRALIRVTGYDDVWVYYGETAPAGYLVYLTVQ